MFDFYRGFRSFLPFHRYDPPPHCSPFSDRVIEASEAKALECHATVESEDMQRDLRIILNG
jgi:hypothetical protein